DAADGIGEDSPEIVTRNVCLAYSKPVNNLSPNLTQSIIRDLSKWIWLATPSR
ncbi:MAG: hypothetical protein IIC84_04080, partial [Chloroflexi bacterium]|nr:hypothetical protein [Chloroflexota bacterium]